MPSKEITPLKEELSPDKLPVLALPILKMAEIILNPKISDETQDNLERLNHALKDTSVIGVGYHPGKIEAIAMPLILRSKLPDLKRIIGPIAAYQHHKPLIQAWEKVSAKYLSTHFLPTVRPGNINDLPYEEYADTYSSNLIHHIQNELPKKGRVYGGIPGAGRSKILQDPDQLNLSFVRGGLNPRGRNPYSAMAGYVYKGRFHFAVTKPLYLSDFPKVIGTAHQKAKQHATIIMRYMAGLLHPELRGSYDPIFS